MQAIKDMGEIDNTLFIYIAGDNGSSAEGGLVGSYNEIHALNGIVSEVSTQLKHIDEWGGPNTFPHFAVGWALAGDTPFQWTKQVASHFGGTRNGMVIPWPKGSRRRARFDRSSITSSTSRRRCWKPPDCRSRRWSTATKQRAMDGTSCSTPSTTPRRRSGRGRSTSRCSATGRFTTTGGSRDTSTGAVADEPLPPAGQDVWELYHVNEDFSQTDDLAAQPAKLKELQDLFIQEAEKTTCSRSTTVGSSASTRRERAGPTCSALGRR